MKTLVMQINELIERSIQSLGYMLWGSEFVSENGRNILRVYIDNKNNDVNVDDCAKCSRQISAVLDVENAISQAYDLEVSSTGIEKPFFTLEQMVPYISRTISIHLYEKVENKKKIKGELHKVMSNKLSIKTSDKQLVEISFSNVKKSRLLYSS